MTHTVDLYWSFRSPYSYIVTPKLLELERDWDAKVNVKPVLPIAVRQPEFFANSDPLWFSYLMRDCIRSAEFSGLPLRWPRPDPVVMDFATRTYPKEQPYIHRLTRLGQLAAERGFGLAFLRQVSHLIWSGAVDGWHEGDYLAIAVRAIGGPALGQEMSIPDGLFHGLPMESLIGAPPLGTAPKPDLAEMDQTIEREEARLDAAIKQNEADQRAGGHYGVPLMVYDGEPFFGQDRYDQLVWRMQQKGMQRRS